VEDGGLATGRPVSTHAMQEHQTTFQMEKGKKQNDKQTKFQMKKERNKRTNRQRLK
jgi:hypothetical protein